jgi:hypothetical protein
VLTAHRKGRSCGSVACTKDGWKHGGKCCTMCSTNRWYRAPRRGPPARRVCSAWSKMAATPGLDNGISHGAFGTIKDANKWRFCNKSDDDDDCTTATKRGDAWHSHHCWTLCSLPCCCFSHSGETCDGVPCPKLTCLLPGPRPCGGVAAPQWRLCGEGTRGTRVCRGSGGWGRR